MDILTLTRLAFFTPYKQLIAFACLSITSKKESLETALKSISILMLVLSCLFYPLVKRLVFKSVYKRFNCSVIDCKQKLKYTTRNSLKLAWYLLACNLRSHMAWLYAASKETTRINKKADSIIFIMTLSI